MYNFWRWPVFGTVFVVVGALFMACLDTQDVTIQVLETNAPPSIQTRTVIPQPGQNLVQVLLGAEDALCPATDFSVPEIIPMNEGGVVGGHW